jgi:anti-sigma regulatory factor (Ser/Thr protein kinase)
MARKRQTRLPLNPRAGSAARRFVEPFRENLDPESFERLRLLVSELVNNSMKHSGRPEGDPIVLTVELENRQVRAEVVDRGAGGDVLRTSPGARGESGWGLFLVDRLADTWGYSGEGPTRVWFTLPTRSRGTFGQRWPENSQADSA